MTQMLHSLLNAVRLPVPAELPNPAVTSITCDSRSVGQGCVFIGLPGERVDGGCFWPEALKAGAVAALIGEQEVAAARAK